MRYLCSLYDLPYQEETKLIKRKIDISIMQKKRSVFLHNSVNHTVSLSYLYMYKEMANTEP